MGGQVKPCFSDYSCHFNKSHSDSDCRCQADSASLTVVWISVETNVSPEARLKLSITDEQEEWLTNQMKYLFLAFENSYFRFIKAAATLDKQSTNVS